MTPATRRRQCTLPRGRIQFIGFIASKLSKEVLLLMCIFQRTFPGADPGFPVGGAPTYDFTNIVQKTAPLLDPPLISIYI